MEIKNLFIYNILLILFIFGMLYFSLQKERTREGYTNSPWKQEILDKFLETQKLINPNIKFDTDQIQKQASQKEAIYFINNGLWPWSEKVKKLYMNFVNSNVFIRDDVQDAMDRARTIYNQNAILRIMALQSKEGQFLLNGIVIEKYPQGMLDKGQGSYGINSGLVDKTKTIIKCEIPDFSDEPTMKSLKYMGEYDGLRGIRPPEKKDIDYKDLEKVVPGFHFFQKDLKTLPKPCNPCVALKEQPDYSCPFRLSVKNDEQVSDVWKYLFKIK